MCEELFASRRVACIFDFRHAIEYSGKAKREMRLQELRSRLKAGGVAAIIGELEPHCERGEAVV